MGYRHRQTRGRTGKAGGREGGKGILSGAVFLIYSIAWRMHGFLDTSYLVRRARAMLGPLLERPAAGAVLKVHGDDEDGMS